MRNLADPSVINSILKQHGLGPKKALGQNFLIDPTVCPRMAELSGADEASGVIEIGPGIGVLTAELSKTAKKVVAIELDRSLIPVLQDTLSGCLNVTVRQGDALRADLAGIIKDELDGGPAAVCANLPYYITSPAIMMLLESRLPISAITVMVQKEAAGRIVADPGSREAGAVSYAVHYYSQPSILFDVPAESFLPKPKVDSCVISLRPRAVPPVTVKSETMMFRIIRLAFNQRRKTILNALSSSPEFERTQISEALKVCGISPMERGERLTLKDFAALADAVS